MQMLGVGNGTDLKERHTSLLRRLRADTDVHIRHSRPIVWHESRHKPQRLAVVFHLSVHSQSTAKT